MRVVIAGSRDFKDYNLLKEKCDEILKGRVDIEIVSGGARGADKLGERYAREKHYALNIFLADWNGLGKSAGYRRNEQMAKYAKEDDGMLIAFWNGSKGTKHMIDLAKMCYLDTHVIRF